VNAESASSYIEFIVGEHPRIPKRYKHFLQFSSKISSSSVTKPYIRTVHQIARQHFRDCVYFWHEMNNSSTHIRQYSCYNWNEIHTARKRIETLRHEEQEQGQEDVRQTETNLGELHQGNNKTDKMISAPVSSRKLYNIKPISDKGYSVIATSDISKGKRILLEAPIASGVAVVTCTGAKFPPIACQFK